MKTSLFLLLTVTLSLCASRVAYAQKSSPATVPAPVTKISAPPAIDGTFMDNTYVNDVLGFSLKLPDGIWSQQGEDQNKADKELGKKLLQSDDKKMNAVLEKSVDTERIVAVFERESDRFEDQSNIVINVKKHPAKPAPLKIGAEMARSAMVASKLFKTVSAVKIVSVGGVEASLIETELEQDGILVMQKMYSLMHNGYYISFSLSYADKSAAGAMDEALMAITFK
jgi:hypothetical protein